jgi:hypothetical protein
MECNFKAMLPNVLFELRAEMIEKGKYMGRRSN